MTKEIFLNLKTGWPALTPNRHGLQLAHPGAVAESADATDLKSVDGDIVRVRPPPAPQIKLRSPSVSVL